MLKHLDKYIAKYVICKGCNYPELTRSLEGKDKLLSKCNSCGSQATHDTTHKAGKELVKQIKSNAAAGINAVPQDITNKDKEQSQLNDDDI